MIAVYNDDGLEELKSSTKSALDQHGILKSI